MSQEVLDGITLGISVSLFLIIIILLIVYPKLNAKKLNKRIESLKRS